MYHLRRLTVSEPDLGLVDPRLRPTDRWIPSPSEGHLLRQVDLLRQIDPFLRQVDPSPDRQAELLPPTGGPRLRQVVPSSDRGTPSPTDLVWREVPSPSTTYCRTRPLKPHVLSTYGWSYLKGVSLQGLLSPRFQMVPDPVHTLCMGLTGSIPGSLVRCKTGVLSWPQVSRNIGTSWVCP